MRKLKFDEALFIPNIVSAKGRKLYSLSHLEILANGDLSDFVRVKNHLYCPECKQAQLVFHRGNNKTSPYLSTKQHNRHVNNCEYTHKPVGKRLSKKYCANIQNRKSINNRLRNLMERVFLNTIQEPEHNPCLITPVELGNVKAENATENGKGHRKILAIPRKRITEFINKSDLGYCKMFYGEVDLKWFGQNRHTKNYELNLMNPTTDKCCCTLMFEPDVYAKLDENFKTNRTAKIAFYASLQQKLSPKGHPYRETQIQSEYHIFFA